MAVGVAITTLLVLPAVLAAPDDHSGSLRLSARVAGGSLGLTLLSPVVGRVLGGARGRWIAVQEAPLFPTFAWAQLLHFGTIALAAGAGALARKEGSTGFVVVGTFIHLVILWMAGNSTPSRLPHRCHRAHGAGLALLWLAYFYDWVRRWKLGSPYPALTLLIAVAGLARAALWFRQPDGLTTD